MIDEDPILKEIVEKSYERCHGSGMFVYSFYRNFMRLSPGVREKFKNSQWDRQTKLLDEAIKQLILFFYEPSLATAERILQLGKSHAKVGGMDIDPELYRPWLEALVMAVAEHDPEFTPQIENAWREVMRHGIIVMQSLYSES